MSIPIIDQLRPLGNFPAVDASDVQAGNQRLSTVLSNTPTTTYVDAVVENKVDKVEGKGLSTNDYTTAEKNKLSGIEANANNYTHPTTAGNKHIPAGGSAGKILGWKADGEAQWVNDQNTQYSDATTSVHGLMSTTDKAKLDGIEAQANNTIVSTSVPSTPTDSTVPSMKLVNDTYASNSDLVAGLATKADASTVTALTSRVSQVETDIDTQTARIDAIAALPSGSTSGDAELIDIRTEVDGTTATNAGTAVREQITDTKNDITEYPVDISNTSNAYFYKDSKTLVEYADTRTCIVNVNGGELYYFRGNIFANMGGYIILDSDDNIIDYFDPPQYGQTTNYIMDEVIIIPKNGVKLYVTWRETTTYHGAKLLRYKTIDSLISNNNKNFIKVDRGTHDGMINTATAPYDNFNTLPDNSSITFESSIISNILNAPITDGYVHVLTFRNYTGTGSSVNQSGKFQIAFCSTTTGLPRLMIRKCLGANEWSDWVNIARGQDAILAIKGDHEGMVNTATSPYDNFNTLPDNSSVTYESSIISSILNSPVTSGYVHVLTFRNYTGTSSNVNQSGKFQIAMSGNANTASRFFIRHCLGANVWSDWIDLSSQGKEDDYYSLSMFGSIGAIGDSYTIGEVYNGGNTYTGDNSRYYSWCKNIGRRNGIDTIVYANGGCTVPAWITNHLPKMLNDDPLDCYFIALGINDGLGRGYSSIGTVSDINIEGNYDENAQTFYGGYSRIIANILNHSPNAKIVLIDICSAQPYVTGQTLIDYNTAISNIADTLNLPMIHCDDDPFYKYELTNFMTSGHPTVVGYSGMSKAIERLFCKAVSDNVTYFKDIVPHIVESD